MNREKIISMLEEIVRHVDEDIYKSIFVKDYIEDEEVVEDTKNELIDIVKKYVE